MSRIGRKPIPVPDKVKITSGGQTVTVEGPLGKLDGILPAGVSVEVKDGIANVIAPAKRDRSNAGYQGLTRALLANMVEGVTKGFERGLEISGVGYKAELQGRKLKLLLGFTHPVEVNLPTGVDAVVDKNQTKLTIKGIDKQLVGQIAAKVRGYKPCEPYKGKGVKYVGEQIKL